MDMLTVRVANFSKQPSFGSGEYKQWIEQDDFVQFLKTLPNLDEMVLYASTGHVFLYAVLVPTRLIATPDIDDLHQWNCNPFSSWGITVSVSPRSKVFLSAPLDHTGSKTIDRGEQITFVRRFDGRQEEQSYIEISQRLTHSFNLHYVSERGAYSRFDKRGDVEDIIHIEDNAFEDTDQNGRIIAIRRGVLDEYMTMTGQSLVLLFDSTRFDPKNFNGWSSQSAEYHKQEPEIWYHMGRNASIASYLRGFQIIRSPLDQKDLIKRYGFGRPDDKEYATFITQDWKHGVVQECSCNPKQLGNYFINSDFPFEISPVFFRPEVLLRYKADSAKYQIQGGSITCRNAWHLQTYDVNEVGQVFTYLKYLSHLPYEEQLYWKSFNESPKGPISKRALQTDFAGNWNVEYDPLQSLLNILRELHEARVLWWKLRDESLMEKVYYPVTTSPDEWASEIHSLDKLVIEGFDASWLRSQATLRGRTVNKDWGTVRLVQEVLLGSGKDEAQMQEVFGPLQELHFLRSKVSGHASGTEAKQIKAKLLQEHKTYAAHFRRLCARCDTAVRMLRTIL